MKLELRTFAVLASLASLGLAYGWVEDQGRETLRPELDLDQALIFGPPIKDPRTPISSLPFTIDSCGSYFLTDCLTGTSGSDGITIDADDVTLDLNGFSLVGVAGSGDAVNVTGDRVNVHVFGGAIRGWDQAGFNGSTDTCVVEGVRAFDNAFDGIVVGPGSCVRDSTCYGNSVNGIAVDGDRCVIVDNHCFDNSGLGIHLRGGTETVVKGNTVNNNGFGIGTDAGITGNLIIQNTASANFGDYFIVAGNAFGPIVNVAGVGDISGTAGSNHPWLNFQN